MMRLRIISINVNSVRTQSRRRAIYQRLSEERSDIIFLQETYLKSNAQVFAAKRDWTHGASFWSFGLERNDGVGILFNKTEIQVEKVLEICPGRCLMLDFVLDTVRYRVINVYAQQTRRERRELFQQMKPYCFTSRVFILCGDFNSVSSNVDRSSSHKRLRYDETFLNNLVQQSHLIDPYAVHCSSKAYTYHKGGNASRIDRVYIKQDMKCSQYRISPIEFSDHCMVSVVLDLANSIIYGKGYWKVNSSVLQDPEFKEAFITFYKERRTTQCLFDSPAEWWECMKADMKQFILRTARRKSSAAYIRYSALRLLLSRMYGRINRGEEVEGKVVSQVKQKMRELQYDRLKSLKAEGQFDNWGVHTPDPFIACKNRISRKVMTGLVDENGKEQSGQKEIHKIICDYYGNLFKKSQINSDHIQAYLRSVTLPKLDPVQADSLADPITVEEVKRSIDSLRAKKSPGLDGLTSELYREFRDILAPDLVEVYNHCLSAGKLLPSQYRSVLVLLAKKGDLKDLKNWRPLSLLNTDYKILAKILYFRLSEVAEELIIPNQTCGVKGRSIEDSLLLVREAVTYIKQHRVGSYVVGLDQSKAFDRVHHEYLYQVLLQYGLPAGFVQWLQVLYKEAVSQPLVNGHLAEPFRVLSGVRQGCPLSPLLYVFSLDPFLRKLQDNRMFKGLRCHLQNKVEEVKFCAYADDVTVLVSSRGDCAALEQEISSFSLVSNSVVNMEKSEALWLGSDSSVFSVPFRTVQDKIRILGVVFGAVDEGKENWEEKLAVSEQKVQGWKQWKLTYQEKVRLMRSFLIPLFLYISVVFPVPDTLLPRLTNVFFHFLWGSRVSVMRRNIVYLPVAEGGLSMPCPELFFNTLFLMKNFSFCKSPEGKPWAVLFKSQIQQFVSVWSVGDPIKRISGRLKNGVSWFGVYIIHKIIKWKILYDDVKQLSRKDLYRNLLRSQFGVHIQLRGALSLDVRQAAKILLDPRLPPHMRDVAWLGFHGKMFVRANLKCRNVPDRSCPREECPQILETMEHLLLECPFSAQVWGAVSRSLQLPHLGKQSYSQLLYGDFPPELRKYNRSSLYVINVVTIYHLWCARCCLTINKEVLSCDTVRCKILESLKGVYTKDLRHNPSNVCWRNIHVSGLV